MGLPIVETCSQAQGKHYMDFVVLKYKLTLYIKCYGLNYSLSNNWQQWLIYLKVSGYVDGYKVGTMADLWIYGATLDTSWQHNPDFKAGLRMHLGRPPI